MSTHHTAVTIRPIETSDQDRWRELFIHYRTFYDLEHDDSVLDTVWQWINNPNHPVNALIADDPDHTARGIAHYRTFPRPSTGTTGTWIDDLYVDTTHRGHGIGRALIETVSTIAGDQDHSVVRWITRENNHTAQKLYDSLAERTTWLVYDHTPDARRRQPSPMSEDPTVRGRANTGAL